MSLKDSIAANIAEWTQKACNLCDFAQRRPPQGRTCRCDARDSGSNAPVIRHAAAQCREHVVAPRDPRRR